MLFAIGIEDVIRAIIPLIFVAIWVISQVMGAKEQQPKKGVAQRRPQPQPPRGGEAERNRDEIRVFLEQATGRREKTAEERGPAQPKPIQREAAAPSRTPQLRSPREEATPERQTYMPPQSPRAPAAEPVVEQVEVVDEVDQISPRISPHVNTSAFTTRSAKMAAEIGLADEKMEAHLHEVFDHSLGTLGKPLSSPSDPDESARRIVRPSRIRAVFRDPQRVREAVVLHEILGRPTGRWR